MEARIISISDLKKTSEEREAERLLTQLDSDKAIEVTVGALDTPRKLTALFRRAAKSLNKEIRIRRREDRFYVLLKS